jgi:hypothetical protein
MGIYSGPLNPVDGLVLYLDASNNASYSGSGNTWYDLSGNSNKATFADSPSFQSLPQSYFNFDGVNDYMTIVRSSSMSPTLALTQEVWFNFPIVPSAAIFIGLQYGTSSNNTYALWRESSSLYGGVNTSGSFSYIGIGTSYMSGNKWHHFVHTYDGSTQKLYLDGVLLNSASITGSIQYDANNTRVLIGADDNGSGYNTGASYPHSGKLNQVRIYNRALSASEILQNYNAQKKRYLPEENIVRNGLILNVDGANSSSYPGSGTSWFDVSGSNNHLTLANGPAFTGTNGGSMYFDGTNDNAISTFTWPNNFTVDITFKLYANSGYFYSRIISTGNNDEFEFAVGENNGLYEIKLLVAGWVATSQYITPDTIQTYTITRSPSTSTIYRNGVLIFTTSVATTVASSLNINLACRHSNQGQNTRINIYNFKIYSRVLSATEIAQNFNALRGRYNI